MLKISDILKKAKKNRLSKVSKAQASERPAPDIELKQPQAQEINPELRIKKTEIKPLEPEVIQQETVVADQDKTEETFSEIEEKAEAEPAQVVDAYQRAISFVQGIMNPLDNGQKGCFLAAEDIIKQFIAFLKDDPNQLLRLFFTEYSVEKGYIYQHSVNVCILCLRLAMDLNYDHTRLRQIGLASLVHDIGLINFDNLISRPARFSDNDFWEIKKHPILGKDVLKKIAQDLDFEIFDVIHQEHERVDGSGYPYGLKDKEICEYARLIAVVDVYEAMNHARPYRKKLGYLKIIKDLINEKNKFEPKFLKTLIDCVGIFPLNTIIRLNTKEIAKVSSQNPKMPLRPVIKVTHDAHGQKLLQNKPVDLSKNFSIYIHDIYNDVNLK
ncbi:MAG: HD domain-containing phosphohydrolase [Candidatus Omnitrophota bacterium]